MSSKPSKSAKLKGKHTESLLEPSNGLKKDVKASKTAPPQPTRVAKNANNESLDENSDDDVSEEENGSESGSEESDDVDAAGINRLMELLGDGELDDIAKSQLELLQAGEDDEEEEEEEDDEEEENEDQEESDEEQSEQEEGVNGLEGEMEGVDLEDVEEIDDDAVPYQKIIINNKNALERIRATIQLDPSFPWTETLAVTHEESIEVDVNDDLKRELAFYKQALACAQTARSLATKHNLPFTRPADFYAEMVKSDAHMERIRQRLLDESASIKKSEEKKREREGKKFGKKVQTEKLKEREKGKKDLEERIQGIKRKRKDALDADDDFDVQLENALTDRPSKRPAHAGQNGKPSMSRKVRDAKYGFGGKVGRRAKQNTKESTDAFASGGKGGGKFGKGKKLPAKRLGKSRRMRAGGK